MIICRVILFSFPHPGLKNKKYSTLSRENQLVKDNISLFETRVLLWFDDSPPPPSRIPGVGASNLYPVLAPAILYIVLAFLLLCCVRVPR
jgi:hypothetical protein